MSWLGQLARRDRGGAGLGPHALLLASLIFMMVALPLLECSAGRMLRFPFLFGLVLIAAVWVNRKQHWLSGVALVAGIGAIACNVLPVFIESGTPILIGGFFSLMLLGLTIFLILNSTARTSRVGVDTVIGGICVYLLIGLSFTTVYRVVVHLDPSAFVLGDLPLAEVFVDESSLPVRLLYFSFITLTTTGFGDITPKSEIAQMLSAAEALTGQLYVAIFVARLMGLHIAAVRPPAGVGRAPVDTVDRGVRLGRSGAWPIGRHR